MGMAVLVIVAVIEAGIVLGIAFKLMSAGSKGGRVVVEQLQSQIAERDKLIADFQDVYGKMIDAESIRSKGVELIASKESLKAERGRNTITQAELETVETRLRELEEIERELEASGLETKEELKILKKKAKDLATKNEALKAQISASLAALEQLYSEIEMSAQMQEQISMMKSELVQCQAKIDILLGQIEQCNDQYFVFKQRYDALDIEYAQLYEKFSASEGGGG